MNNNIGLQKSGNTFSLFQTFCIAGVLKLPLIMETDIIHHVVEKIDDVENDADIDVEKYLWKTVRKPLSMSQQRCFTRFLCAEEK